MSDKISSIVERMENIEKAVTDLAKMNPMAAGALRGAAVGAVTGGIKGAAMGKAETLEKPPVSEAQRRAMHAAASGNSTLGIPSSVGKDFADADKGGKLPEKKKKKDKKKLKKTEERLENIAKSLESLFKAVDATNGKQHFNEKFYPGQADLEHGKDDANNQDNAPGADKPKKEKEETLNADNDGKLEKRPDTASKAATNPDDGKGAYLQETVGKAEERTINYGAMKPPKADEANAPGISYRHGRDPIVSAPTAKPSTTSAAQRQAQGAAAQTAMRERRTAAAGGKPQYEAQQHQRARTTAAQTYERRKEMKKSELFTQLDSKTLTNHLRKSHSDQEIGMMIKAACDTGKVHRNVLLEWQNYRTVNPAILAVYEEE